MFVSQPAARGLSQEGLRLLHPGHSLLIYIASFHPSVQANRQWLAPSLASNASGASIFAWGTLAGTAYGAAVLQAGGAGDGAGAFFGGMTMGMLVGLVAICTCPFMALSW